jgi:hypothetical protein
VIDFCQQSTWDLEHGPGYEVVPFLELHEAVRAVEHRKPALRRAVRTEDVRDRLIQVRLAAGPARHHVDIEGVRIFVNEHPAELGHPSTQLGENVVGSDGSKASLCGELLPSLLEAGQQHECKEDQ